MNFQHYFEEHMSPIEALRESDLNEFLSGLQELRDLGGVLWVAGNGGSAGTASHAVADFVKTSTSFGSAPLRSIALSELVSLNTAVSNDISFPDSYSFALEALAGSTDALMILSVSGLSPNLLAAMRAAKELNLKVFAITGSRGSELCEQSDFGIRIESDDYQIVENLHVMLLHWFTKELGSA